MAQSPRFGLPKALASAGSFLVYPARGPSPKPLLEQTRQVLGRLPGRIAVKRPAEKVDGRRFVVLSSNLDATLVKALAPTVRSTSYGTYPDATGYPRICVPVVHMGKIVGQIAAAGREVTVFLEHRATDRCDTCCR